MSSVYRTIRDAIIANSHNVAFAEQAIAERLADVPLYMRPGDPAGSIDQYLAGATSAMIDMLGQVHYATQKTVAGILRAAVPQVAREAASIDIGILFGPNPAASRQVIADTMDSSQIKNLGTKLKARAFRIIAKGTEAGTPQHEIAAELAEKIGTPRDWMRVVRTEVASANTLATQGELRRNADLVAGEEYLATLDTRTCPVCAPDDGKRYYYEPTRGQLGLDDQPRVPRHPNCRCAYSPILRSRDEIADRTRIPRSALPETMPTDAKRLTYDDWIREQPQSVQLDALGEDRYAAFARGVTLDKFVSGGRALEPEELAELTPGRIARVTPAEPVSEPMPAREAIEKRRVVGDVSKRVPSLARRAGAERRTKRRPRLATEAREHTSVRRVTRLAVVDGKAIRSAHYITEFRASTPERLQQWAEQWSDDPLPDVRVRGADALRWPTRNMIVLDTEDGYVDYLTRSDSRGAVPVLIHPALSDNRITPELSAAILRAKAQPDCPIHGPMRAQERRGTLVRFGCPCRTQWEYV